MFEIHDIRTARLPYLTLSIIVSIIVLMGYAVYNLASGEILNASILCIVAIVIAPLIYLMRKGHRGYLVSVYTLAVLLFFATSFTFVTRMQYIERSAWFGFFGFIFFYLLGFKKGLYFAIMQFGVYILAYLFMPEQITSQIPLRAMVHISAAYWITAFIAGLHVKMIDVQTAFLKEKADHDYLTGVYNRSAFIHFFEREFQFMLRNNSTDLALILLDIDNFKKVNDSFGHDAGDNLIRDLVELISKNLRTSDIPARWGGEEFAIALPEASLEQASSTAEKLRQIIADHKFETVGHITASFGVAQFKQTDSVSSIFSRTDHALLRAKRMNKNCVECAS